MVTSRLDLSMHELSKHTRLPELVHDLTILCQPKVVRTTASLSNGSSKTIILIITSCIQNIP